MIERHRGHHRLGGKRSTLSTGASVLALQLATGGITALTAAPAFADCDATAPESGDTVTCDADAPNPETDAIIAPGSTDVTVNFQSNAQLETTASPAISLGSGVVNMMPGSQIADFDPGTIPAVIGDVIDGDFTGIATHQDLVDLYDDIRAQTPVRATPADATISVNDAVLDGATVLSAGAAGTRFAGVLELDMTDSTLATLTENAPAVLLDGAGGLDVWLDDGAILTFFDGSAGVSAATGGSVSLLISGDSQIYTAGDDAPAILGPGTSSVFNLEIDGSAATDGLPTIATFGDNSPGIFMHGAGGSTATLQFENLSSTLGPALQTNGANSTLIDMDLGPSSSLGLSAENTSFGTFGDGSNVLNLLVGDISDTTVFLQDSTLTSTGANATLLETSHGATSITDLVVIGSTFQAAGDGSGGIVQCVTGGGDDFSNSNFLSEVTVETAGDDAPAFLIEEGGAGSARSTDIFSSDFSTVGANSAGVFIGGLGNGSSMEQNMDDVTIATVGANSPGLFVGGLGNQSAWSTSVSNTDIATQGDNSIAFTALGVEAGGSVAGLDLLNLNLSTQGDNSIGLFAPMLRNGSGVGESTGVASADFVTVSTQGAGSTGIVFGDASLYGDAAPNIPMSTLVLDFSHLTVETNGDDADGIVVYGLGAGATDSLETLSFINSAVTTTGDRSRGIVLETGIPGATDSDITTFLDALDVTTSGEEAHGLVLGEGLGTEIPGANTNNTFVLGNVTASTSGTNAHALVIGEGTTLTLNDANIGATTANGTIVHGTIDTFNNLVATGFGGRAVQNNGIVYDTFMVGTGVQGNLANNGLIEGLGGVAVRYDVASEIDDIFELQPMGVVIGTVEAGAGTDTFILGGEGIQTFDQTLIGTQYNDFEEFAKEDSSTWTLTGSNAVAAPFLVAKGTLVNNATIANMLMTVGPDGRLEGNGTVGNVTSIGGTIAAGNSIGTLTVGSLSLDADSTLEVEVDDMGNSDLVIANGSVTLGGATLDVVESGSFSGTDPFNYLIIDNDAADAVNGTFGTIQNDFAFLTPTVAYAGGDGNDVTLTLTPNGAPPPPPPPPPEPPPPVPDGLFETAASTYNQIGSARRLENLDRTTGSDADLVYMNVLFSTVPQAQTAFDTTSGEIYASLLAQAGSDGLSRTQRLVARSHESFSEGWGIWGGVTGRDGSVDGDGNAADANHDEYGFDLRLDYRGHGNGWAFGANVGLIDGGLDVDARLSRAEYDGWRLGAYTRYGTGGDGVTLTGAIDYTDTSASVTRGIVVNTLDRRANAGVDIEAIALQGEARYGLALGDGWSAGPLASVHYAEADLGRVAETGADALNLSSTGASDDITRFGGGLFANWQGARGRIDASAQYVDGHSNVAQIGLALDGAPDALFPVRSPRTDGSAGLFALSGRYELEGGWTIGSEARALIGSDEQSVGGSLTVGWTF